MTRINVDACKCTEHGEKECFEAKQERWIKTHDELEATNMKRKQALNDLDKPQHTPVPWEVHEGQDYIHIYGGDHDHSGAPLASVCELVDAHLIARAVNSHEELLEALKREHSFHCDDKQHVFGKCKLGLLISRAEGHS